MRKQADWERIPDKQKKRDFAYFELVGGPYHGLKVRMYAPWDAIKYPGGIVYTIHPPLDPKKGMWVYVHDPDYTEQP